MREKDQPLVTIGIPTYNRAATYLNQAMQCAVNQTYPNIEIIVSDNCSTDNTGEIVKKFGDPRIKYYKQQVNIGAVPNSNFCLKQSKGYYFLQLHDDDMIDDDFIEICMKAADYSTDVGIIRTGTRVIDSHGQVLQESRNMAKGLSTKEFTMCWFQGKTSMYFCSTLFNTDGLRKIGGFKSKHNLADDGFAIFKLEHMLGRVDVEDVKASFRKHPGEITFAVNVMKWCEDYLLLLDLICEITNGDDEVKYEGMQFFIRINYNRARAIKSPIKRLLTYMKVYEKFEYRYSPLRYLLYPHFLRMIRRCKNLIR